MGLLHQGHVHVFGYPMKSLDETRGHPNTVFWETCSLLFQLVVVVVVVVVILLISLLLCFQLMQCDFLGLFAMALRVSFLLFEGLRVHLKFQMEVSFIS